MGKISKVLLNGGGGLAGSMQMDRRYMFMEKMSSGGCLPLGYKHVYDHNIQTSSLKPLGKSSLAKAKLYVEHR